MTSDPLATVLWRRKWTVLGCAAVLALATALFTSTLEKEYETSTSFLISQPEDAQTFDAVQAAQVAARTYATLITGRNLANRVSRRLGGTPSGGDLEGKVSAEPIAETQLLRLTVTDTSPARAVEISSAYAAEFTESVRRTLTPATRQNVSLADPATLPENAVRPKPKLYVGFGLLLGLGLGIALALLRERLDRRVRTTEQLTEDFGLPILTNVPRKGRSELSQAAFTDAFRLLRTNLQFVHADAPPRVVAVTSYHRGEGKSTVSTQLSLVTAASASTALLVEADVRNPSQQPFFFPGQPPLTPGLTSYVVGGAALDDVVHSTRMGTIDLIPAGPAVPSLAGLLESGRGRTFFEDVAGRADLVVVDCPPLTVGADAVTIAGRVDAVVLVVDMSMSTAEELRAALRQLAAVRAPVVGFAINRDNDVAITSYGYGTPDGGVQRELTTG